MSGQPDDPHLADSRLLSRWVAELAARELSSLGDDYRLTTRDHGGEVVGVSPRNATREGFRQRVAARRLSTLGPRGMPGHPLLVQREAPSSVGRACANA